MNKTFVASLENHTVYLISNEYVSFYLNVLNKSEITNISVDIKGGKSNNIHEIINYYEKIDNYNITLAIPLNKFEENVEDFKSQSNIISKVINYSYKFLTSNGIVVNNNINVIKHGTLHSDFIDFFINTFANRVRYLKIDDLVREEVPYNKISTANISFVVGRPELDITIKEDDMQEIIKETENIASGDSKKMGARKLKVATSGYVSYYLLGFITAVLTLVFITLVSGLVR